MRNLIPLLGTAVLLVVPSPLQAEPRAPHPPWPEESLGIVGWDEGLGIRRESGRTAVSGAKGEPKLMANRKYGSVAIWAFVLVAGTCIWFVGPPSPAGRYEVTLPPMSGGSGSTEKLHLYLQLAEGKVAMVSNYKRGEGKNVLALGTYEHSTNGWTANVGREDDERMALKVEPSWLGIKLSNTNTSWKHKRCFHFWE